MIGIIVQARMSSSRLPGKVLLPINGQPMLALQISRLLKTKLIDQVIVATSEDTSDDPIEQLCLEQNIPCYRGDLNDVLARFYQCANAYKLKHIVRICGDCPLIDPVLIDSIVTAYLSSHSDYTSNVVKRCFPDGQDIEVFTFNALETAFLEAKKPSEREHVTPFIRDSGLFPLSDYTIDEDFSLFRVSVDHQQDFDVISTIYSALKELDFGYKEIVNYLKMNPHIVALNAHVEINEGYKLSLLEDKAQGFN